MGNENIEWNSLMDPAGQYVHVNTKADETGDYPFKYLDFSLIFSDVVIYEEA